MEIKRVVFISLMLLSLAFIISFLFIMVRVHQLQKLETKILRMWEHKDAVLDGDGLDGNTKFVEYDRIIDPQVLGTGFSPDNARLAADAVVRIELFSHGKRDYISDVLGYTKTKTFWSSKDTTEEPFAVVWKPSSNTDWPVIIGMRATHTEFEVKKDFEYSQVSFNEEAPEQGLVCS